MKAQTLAEDEEDDDDDDEENDDEENDDEDTDEAKPEQQPSRPASQVPGKQQLGRERQRNTRLGKQAPTSTSKPAPNGRAHNAQPVASKIVALRAKLEADKAKRLLRQAKQI